MAASEFFCLLVTISITWRCVNSQIFGLGPDECLKSRLDVIPCSFGGDPEKAPVPGRNQYGVYNTQFISESGAGFPTCRIRRRQRQINPIQVIGSTNQVYIVYSPGFKLNPPEEYGNQLYVDYRIQCGEGRLSFLNITSINIEPKNCENPLLSDELSCVDYVQVLRGGFGVTENCGNDTEGNNDQLEQGDLRILFRTSDTRRCPGFEATVICFDPEEANLEGCTRPVGENDTMATSAPPQGQRRRKRDLEMFNNRWKRRASYISRMKRQALGRDMIRLRFLAINVSHGMYVTFSNRKLDFIDNSIIDTIEDVYILHTFDAAGEQDEFKGEAKVDSGELILFPGPGPMYIVGRDAYFTLFVIDPRGLIPNAEEMMVLANLTEAQLEVRTEDESLRLSEEFLEPPTTDEFSDLFRGRRRRRQTNPEPPPSFQDQVILVALQNANACNPVLRASANSIIEEVQATEPDRLVALMATLPTDPSDYDDDYMP